MAFLPVDPNTHDIYHVGLKTYRWDGNSWTKTLATDVANSYLANIDSSVVPLVDNAVDLGSNQYKWKNIFLANSITSNIWINLYSSNISEKNNLFFTNNRITLYLTGNLQKNIIPNIDSTSSLGNSNYRSKELYLSNQSTFLENTSTVSNVKFLGTVNSNQFVDTSQSLIYAEGNVNHYFENSSIFYHSNINTNFTANFVNIPNENNKLISIALVLQQHANAYIANGLQINNVDIPLKFINGIIPTGTAGNINIQNFTLLRSNDNWIALSSLSTYL